MKKIIACLCFLFAARAGAEPAGAVSALVQTVPLRQMNLSDRVTGYGTVQPEPGATENLNLPRAGRVLTVPVSAGQTVEKGQTLVVLDADPAGQMSYRQAENAVAYAASELTRTRSLFAKQLATRLQVDAAEKALKDAEQALAAQNAVGNGDNRTKLVAPFGGLVVATSVSRGDRVQAGANLVQLSHTATMRAQIGIEPGDSRSIRVGMGVKLTSVFDPAQAAEGKVVQVGGQIDPQTQLVPVTARFPGGVFLPGSRVQGEIATANHAALAVPRSAVLRDESGDYLFQVVAGKAKRVAVQSGIEDGDWVEVRGSGLLKAPVVSVGNYELNDGMAVREGRP